MMHRDDSASAKTPNAAREKDRSSDTDRLPPARLLPALRDGIRQTWDRLGLVMAVTATWTALLLIPLSVASLLPASVPLPARYAILLLVTALIGSVPTAGAFAVAQRIAERREAAYADFWREGFRHLGPALRLSLIQQAGLALFAVNFWFYLAMGGMAGRIASILCLYLFVFFLMMCLYHWPLLIAQESGVFDEPDRRAKRGAWAVLRRAFFLALGRPFYALGLLIALLLVSALLFATLALPALLWIGSIAMLATYATRALLVQYEVLPAPQIEEPVPDEKFRIQG